MEFGPTPETDTGRLSRIGILRPLRIRDFALLWAGATVSLIGDGVYVVALAWQVYELSDSPTALSLVGVAWTLPVGLFVLVGGVVSDRFERRRIMIAADLVRAAAAATIGVLSLTGAIELWHLIALAAVFGTGEAFFGPAFLSIVPQIVPRHLLLQANSLDQFIRPFAFLLVGPALGGLLVASFGPGQAFMLDAGTFLVSAAAIFFIRHRGAGRDESEPRTSMLRDLREGFAFVRAHAWLWATLLAAAVFLLAYWGPVEVLVPYRVRNELGGSAGDFGLVLACGGVGSILAALILGQRGLPRRHITFMYSAWTIGSLALVGFGVAGTVWQLQAISLLEGAVLHRRHGRLGDAGADARPRRAARPCDEPRLVRVDEPRADLVRADGAGLARARRPDDARRRRHRRGARHNRVPLRSRRARHGAKRRLARPPD